MLNIRFPRLTRFWLALFMCLIPAAASAADTAQEARWKELNVGIVEAYQRGAYDRIVALAEEAQRFAEEVFGNLDERTLLSLNNRGCSAGTTNA